MALIFTPPRLLGGSCLAERDHPYLLTARASSLEVIARIVAGPLSFTNRHRVAHAILTINEVVEQESFQSDITVLPGPISGQYTTVLGPGRADNYSASWITRHPYKMLKTQPALRPGAHHQSPLPITQIRPLLTQSPARALRLQPRTAPNRAVQVMRKMISWAEEVTTSQRMLLRQIPQSEVMGPDQIPPNITTASLESSRDPQALRSSTNRSLKGITMLDGVRRNHRGRHKRRRSNTNYKLR